MFTRMGMTSHNAGTGRGPGGAIRLLKGMGLAAFVVICIIMLSNFNSGTASAADCVCTSCHGINHHGVNFTVAGKVNGVAVGCSSSTVGCHLSPPQTGAHSVHTAALSNSTYGNSVTSTEGTYVFGCGHCHSLDVSKHNNGKVDIELTPTAVATGQDGTQICSDCHGSTGPHGTNCSSDNSSSDCLSCHSIKQGNTSPVIAGVNHHSGACAGCHSASAQYGLIPHDGTPPDSTNDPCVSCHTAGAQATHHAGTATSCVSCHTYPGVTVPASTNTNCLTCHSDQQGAFGPIITSGAGDNHHGSTQNCTVCHNEQMKPLPTTTNADCAQCHVQTISLLAHPAAGTCTTLTGLVAKTSCDAASGVWSRVTPGACTDCHQPGVPVDKLDPDSVDATCAHCHGASGPGPNEDTAWLMAHIPTAGMHSTPVPTAAFSIAVTGSHHMGVTVTSASKDATGFACAGTACTYSWTMTDGTPSSAGNVASSSTVYSTNGTKSITLTVTDSVYHTTSTVTHTVNIAGTNTAPTVTPSATQGSAWNVTLLAPTADADGDTVTVSSINWGEGSPVANPSAPYTHTYTTAGTKTITVTVTDGTASSSASTTITLSQFVISGNVGDTGVTVTLSGGPTTGSVTSGSDGSFSFSVNPGTYTLTPSKTGKTFTPASMTGIIVGPSASGITFGAVRYQLDVVKQLAGSTCAVGAASCGSVSSDVSGIACGTSCSGTYDSGQVVVLTSTAPTGKNTTWSGAACTSGGGSNLTAGVTTCTLTMSSAKSVTVNYTTPSAPALTINKVTIASGSTPVANLGTVTGGSFTTADTGTCTTLTGQVTKAACLATLPTAGVWTAASTSCGNTLATCGPVSEVLNGSYTLAATPASGHALKSLTDCAQNFTVVGGGTVTCVSYRQATVTMNASKTIQVNFDH